MSFVGDNGDQLHMLQVGVTYIQWISVRKTTVALNFCPQQK